MRNYPDFKFYLHSLNVGFVPRKTFSMSTFAACFFLSCFCLFVNFVSSLKCEINLRLPEQTKAHRSFIYYFPCNLFFTAIFCLFCFVSIQQIRFTTTTNGGAKMSAAHTHTHKCLAKNSTQNVQTNEFWPRAQQKQNQKTRNPWHHQHYHKINSCSWLGCLHFFVCVLSASVFYSSLASDIIFLRMPGDPLAHEYGFVCIVSLSVQFFSLHFDCGSHRNASFACMNWTWTRLYCNQ